MLLAVLFAFQGCVIRHEAPEPISGVRAKVVGLARSLEGLSYRYGGKDIDGFDCSGLVYYVFHAYGIELPRTAEKQRKFGQRIPLRLARPGDILVFKINGGFHSGIYLGNSTFMHAPGKRKPVKCEGLTVFWRKKIKAVADVISHRRKYLF